MANGETSTRPSLVQIVRAFGYIGVISMGGGRLAFYFDELATRRRWLTTEALLEDYALASLLPGPNIGNFATLLGRQLRGLSGAALALLVTLLPGGALMVALSALYFTHGHLPVLAPIFRGIAPAAAGLTLGTTAQIVWRQARSPVPALVAALTAATILVLRVPTLPAILVIGGVTALVEALRRRQR